MGGKLNEGDFYQRVIQDCIGNGIKLSFVNKYSHMGCGGWFDDQKKELMVCTKRLNWIALLVHEYAHYRQWIEKSPLWFHNIFENKKYADFSIWDLKNYKGNEKTFKDLFKKTCEVEIDCDMRAVKFAKRFNLPIDLPEYIQSSNCYHACYYYFWKFKCFYDPKYIPYHEPELLDNFSATKILDFKLIWRVHKPLELFLKQYNKPLPQ